MKHVEFFSPISLSSLVAQRNHVNNVDHLCILVFTGVEVQNDCISRYVCGSVRIPDGLMLSDFHPLNFDLFVFAGKRMGENFKNRCPRVSLCVTVDVLWHQQKLCTTKTLSHSKGSGRGLRTSASFSVINIRSYFVPRTVVRRSEMQVSVLVPKIITWTKWFSLLLYSVIEVVNLWEKEIFFCFKIWRSTNRTRTRGKIHSKAKT